MFPRPSLKHAPWSRTLPREITAPCSSDAPLPSGVASSSGSARLPCRLTDGPCRPPPSPDVHAHARLPGGEHRSLTPRPTGITGPTTAFHDSVAARYNYAFGKDTPFLPSNATSSNGQFLSPKSFPTAQYCGHCHQEAYRQWRQSVHSNSFRAPWYLKNVNMLIDEKGVQFSRHCEGCHNPVALLSGDLSQGMPKKRPFEDEGITCTTCHSIQSMDTTGTGSYVMGTPAVLVDEGGAPVIGPVSDAEILSHLDRHSKAVMRPLYRTAEFCAACHKAAIPRTLDDYKWLRAFRSTTSGRAPASASSLPCPFTAKTQSPLARPAIWCANRSPRAPSIPAPRTDSSSLIAGWAATPSCPQYYKFDEQAEKAGRFPQECIGRQGCLQRGHLRP